MLQIAKYSRGSNPRPPDNGAACLNHSAMMTTQFCFKWLFRDISIKHHMIVGDFNLDAKKSNQLTSFFTKDMGLKQLIDRPTHKEGRTIDHCYISPGITCNIKFVNPYYTDHTAFCIKLS